MTTPPSDNPGTEVLPTGNPGACPGAATLKAIIEDPTIDDPQVTAHLETCEPCRQRLDAMAGQSYSLGLARGDRAPLDPLSPNNVDAAPDDESTPDPHLARALAAAHSAIQTPAADHAALPDDLRFLSPPRSPGYIGALGSYDIIQCVGQGGMG